MGAGGALPAAAGRGCAGLLLSVTPGTASLCSLHRKLPHCWVPAASCSLVSPRLPLGVWGQYLQSILFPHPPRASPHARWLWEAGTAWHRGVWKIPDGLTRAAVACFSLRILSYNNLSRLDEGSLADLGGLHVLRLSHNSINHIAEGAFRGLKNLRVL